VCIQVPCVYLLSAASTVIANTRVAIKISFRKNSPEQTRNGFRYSAEKSAHSAEFRVHQKSQIHSSEPNGTKRNSAEIMKFYETASKRRRILSVFCSINGLERIFKCFLFRKWLGMEFQVLFSSENGLERNSEVFSSKNSLERNSKVLSLENGLERNSKGFSIQRNGSEWNSEVFLFRETGGIPIELPSVPSCFVFRGIIFLSEIGNPSPSWSHGRNRLTIPRILQLPIEH
jgi:hypothetical protein